MTYTSKVEKAIRRAAELHDGQLRKNKETPYVAHLFAVMFLVSEYTNDEDILCAALLHDTLEDVQGYAYKDLEEEFGTRIADIVDGVTQADMVGGFKGLTTQEEKMAKVEQYREVTFQKLKDGPAESAYVSAADKIHNLRSMQYDYEQQGAVFLEQFIVPIEKRLAGYKEILTIIRGKIDSPITNELEMEIQKAKKVFL